MTKLFLFFILSSVVALTFAQLPVSIELSDKHLVRIENLPSAKQKIKLYRKYYRKDSFRLAKQFEKKIKLDSGSLLKEAKENSFSRFDKTSPLGKSFGDLPGLITDTAKFNSPDSILNNEIVRLQDKAELNVPIYPDTSQSLLLQMENFKTLKDNKPEEFDQLAKEVAAQGYEIKKYEDQANNYLKRDSVLVLPQEEKDKIVKLSMARLEETNEIKLANDYAKQAKQFDPIPEEYANEFGHLQDSSFSKERARELAEKMALSYIVENPAIMKAAQSKMNFLMKTYSIVPNSNDLSSAIKRESLKGKSIKERLYIAGNFQVLSIKPFSFDFSPMVGYRFNCRFIGGLGANYRKTFGDSLTRIASDVLGYKVFLSYDVIRSFFAYTEFINNSTSSNQVESSSKRGWDSSFLLGVGKKFTIHPKVEMTVLALYNFTHTSEDVIYVGPWSVRFGFQFSKLALLKRKPDFKF